MNSCRICRTKTNLKYTPEQLAKKRKKANANEQREIMDANATLFGNICLECEVLSLNFHKLDEQMDLEVDSGREETPVIVDDDDMLYNLYFEATKRLELSKQTQLPMNSLSCDCDTEVIELTSSHESTPVPPEKIVAVIDLSDYSLSDEETSVTAANQKRKRHKKYDENKFVFTGKLNLVSSDSEEDDIYPPSKRHTSYYAAAEALEKPPVKIEQLVENENISTEKTDAEQTLVNNEICHVCLSVFCSMQTLVHHIRLRHRSDEEQTQLRERVRHAQDSALTIRLCFRARFLFYECQMCGRIDSTFKEHKEHVIAKHSAELVSLKDPFLKRLHCPVCKCACGTLYIEVCRHVLQTHSAASYKFYMKEVIAELDQDLKTIAATARVYQFHKRLNLYFLCRHCDQLSSSISVHRKHVKEKHQLQAEVAIANAQVEQQALSVQPAVRILREKKPKQIFVEPEKTQQKTETTKPVRTKIKSTKLKEATSTFINQNKKDKKPAKLVKTIVKKGVGGTQDNKRGRGRRPKAENLQRVAFKFNLHIKQIPTQTYNCQYCKQMFKGFLLWNAHYLKEHKECFEWKNSVEDSLQSKRKHKKKSSLNLDENSNATKTTKDQIWLTNEIVEKEIVDMKTDDEPKWLQELLAMHQRRVAEQEKNEEMIFSSGLLEMIPNIAILEQTVDLRHTN